MLHNYIISVTSTVRSAVTKLKSAIQLITYEKHRMNKLYQFNIHAKCTIDFQGGVLALL